jgi:hypothetical protein
LLQNIALSEVLHCVYVNVLESSKLLTIKQSLPSIANKVSY